MKRRFAVAALLCVALTAPALAQTDSASVDILDVNVGRYDEDGRVTMVVEFRNVEELDAEDIVVTENGEPAEAA